MARSQGFTLLELMLVLLLLSSVAMLVIATMPSQTLYQQAEKLQLRLQWAAARAQTEGHIYRLTLADRQWQLSRLSSEAPFGADTFTGYHWQEVGKQGHHTLPENIHVRLWREGQPVPLPASLHFMPDGHTAGVSLSLSDDDDRQQYIRLTDGEILLEDPL